MSPSWIERARQFKSSCRVVAGFLLRSRETQARRARNNAQKVQRLKRLLERERRINRQQFQQKIVENQQRIAQLERENQQLRQRPPILPEDPPLPRHQFGPRLIALCVNLVRRIGLRAVPDVLQTLFAWLEVEVKVPDWTTIRTWVQRVGIAALERPVEPADDWIWLADHSNQIGTEKVLAILGVRASQLPPPGQALRHEDVRVLELCPGTSWKRADMAAAYQRVAERCGTPLAVLIDGAAELREGAQALQTAGKNVLVLGDFKHHAANVLKKLVGGDARFHQFRAHLSRTRVAIQQTELAHLTPPGSKPKARFMNLQPTLQWAKMLLWQLDHPDSQARREISVERMDEKLGWLREFRESIERWHVCQAVVSAGCTFINEQGLFRGAARQLQTHLRELSRSEPSEPAVRQTIASLLRFVRRFELQLTAGQRLPLSTEILESSFGLFKRLERQHNKGGFTGLLAAYGSLLHASTPASIRRDFAQVSVQQMKAWVTQKLGATLASKRQTAYQEFRHCGPIQTQTC